MYFYESCQCHDKFSYLVSHHIDFFNENLNFVSKNVGASLVVTEVLVAISKKTIGVDS